MTEQVRVLLVDDDEDDFIITRDLLAEVEGHRFTLDWVNNYQAAAKEISRRAHDVYLLDYQLGESDGLELMRQVIGEGCRIPLILLTGQGDRETDMAAMRAGAADFLIKRQLNAPLLERSIRYAIERGRAEQRLARMAQYDFLTGLPNRQLFQDRLRQTLAMAEREAFLVGVMFLDLDRFKVINDTLGHAAGDALLKKVAERLTLSLRKSDTVARLGGDEFVIILPHLRQIRNAATLARRMADTLAEPFELEGHEVFTAGSIGISLYPFDGKEPETLLKCADTAMYQAKQKGGNSYWFFSPDMNVQTSERLVMESRLRHALEREEFSLWYQPQFSLESGAMVGMEALLRWHSPGHKTAGPAEFIPLLEETGIIVPVGEWVLRTACRQNRNWQDASLSPPRVSVNLSGRQVKRPDLLAVIARLLAETGLDPTSLELELTETVIMQNVQETIDLLRALKNMGVSLVIDDFGTGYSQLNYLKYFPIDKLKIDRSFIANIGRDRGDEALSRAIIGMAHSLGVKVLAEGVETEDQLAFLRENGCDEAQGFYFARPMPAAEMAAFIGGEQESRLAK